MDNVIESVSIIPKQLYSLKNNKGNIPRKLIENIIINNKYATTIRVSEFVYTSRSYRLTSMQKYIYHLYINRTNRIFGRRSKISMEFYHMSDMCKKFHIIQNSESPVVFFPDKHTLCIIPSPKIGGFIGTKLVEGDSTACCVEITFVGKNANCIFLASINYYDNLDPVLIRDGRFDVKIELPYFNKQQMTQMCEHFEVDKKEVFEYNNCPSLYYDDDCEICPETLQNMILSYQNRKRIGGN